MAGKQSRNSEMSTAAWKEKDYCCNFSSKHGCQFSRHKVRTLLDQHQQAGRAGRDGAQGHVIIVYHGNQLAHCEEGVKDFVKAKTCLRIAGYESFDSNIESLEPKHNCCSNCAPSCNCLTDFCKVKLPFETDNNDSNQTTVRTRIVTTEDKEVILHFTFYIY